ncbi:acyltransferase [Streptomyces sp. NPDC058001]|uniref:acyltransferase family protein n=1 Tax=Streptomyces sp. NPDC058001 TaxID=3346300 RepID=UPI0036E2CF59
MRAERNRCADLLRVCAIGAVVLGHWLLVDVTYQGGTLSGLDALDYVGWARWLTLLLQVMPVFFLVGGYANAVSWTARRAKGEDWWCWVRGRAIRLLWPTVFYVAVCAVAAVVAQRAGADPTTLARAGWLVALHLWFLPLYVLLIALTPPLHAAHRRWGLRVPVVMALVAAGVDILVLGPRLPLIGFLNYLLVWGCMHQWGFAWQDGSLTTPRWRCRVMAATGFVLLVALLGWGPFPVDMIGAGTRVGNTSPPSIALLAFAATQIGLLLMAEPALQRLLTRPRLWARVTRLNKGVMTVYLWHMVPVIVVAVAFYPTRLLPQTVIGTSQWWVQRVVWIALLSVVLAAVVLCLTRVQRPLRRLPVGAGARGWWSPVLLVCGLGACVPALTALAVQGFAPAGHLAVLPLLLLAVGLPAAVCSGRPPPARTRDGAPETPGRPPSRRTPKGPLPRGSVPKGPYAFRIALRITSRIAPWNSEHPAVLRSRRRHCHCPVHRRSFSGFRTDQMCLIRPSAMSNAMTVTVTPPC